MKKRIAILASGTGSNAAQLVRYFNNHSSAEVVLLVSNNPNSGVFDIGLTHSIDALFITNQEIVSGEKLVDALVKHKIDLVVLAGFLRKIPQTTLQAFPNRIINIHPALLPDFGGKGMYGNHVHEAVRQSGATQTGITIHLVDDQYDHGAHLAQYSCAVKPEDTVDRIAEKVQKLEHEFYPIEVEKFITSID
jgi:phosphoribosylglycinamide formyltransferase 1